MGARRIRRHQRQVDMAASRLRNGIRKSKERTRRDGRMVAFLRKARMPYPRVVMNWLSSRLDKPSRLITQADVDVLLK